MPEKLSPKLIQSKLQQYRQELDELTEKYNKILKYSPGGVIHEDAASEYKYFQRKVLEGKIRLTEEIIREYEDMVGK